MVENIPLKEKLAKQQIYNIEEIVMELWERTYPIFPNEKNPTHIQILKEIILEKSQLIPGPSTKAGTKRYYYRAQDKEVHLVTPDYAKQRGWKPAEKQEVGAVDISSEKDTLPQEFSTPQFKSLVTKMNNYIQSPNGMYKKIIASSDEERENIHKYMKFFGQGIDKLIDNNTPQSEKKKTAQQLIQKYQLSTNQPIPNDSGKVKLYVGNYVGKQNRKILGNPSATLYKFAQLLQHYGGNIPARTVGGSSESVARNRFAAFAKPTYPNESVVSNKESQYIHKVFQSFPGLPTEQYKKIYGLTENGKFVPANTPSNQRKNFEWSVKNDSSLERLKKYTKSLNTPTYKAIYNSIVEHQKSLYTALKQVPSKKAEQLVNQSYAKLVHSFVSLDPDVAGASVKNLAETALYHTMLARGEEVYLPSAGNFPVGDVIHVKSKGSNVTKVESVSVKYGKGTSGGRAVYGFPGQASTLQFYHSNPNKRNLIGTHLSENKHSLLIHDDIITKNQLPQLIKESGIPFSPKQTKDINDLAKKTYNAVTPLIQKYMKKYGVGYQRQIEKDLKKVMAPYDKQLKQLFKEEDLGKVVGSNNARALWNQTGVAQFLSCIATRNLVITSNGFQNVRHNKQDYVDGKYIVSENNQGTTNMDEWLIDYRMYATTSRNGGGILISYTGGQQKKEDMVKSFETIIKESIKEVLI